LGGGRLQLAQLAHAACDERIGHIARDVVIYHLGQPEQKPGRRYITQVG